MSNEAIFIAVVLLGVTVLLFAWIAWNIYRVLISGKEAVDLSNPTMSQIAAFGHTLGVRFDFRIVPPPSVTLPRAVFEAMLQLVGAARLWRSDTTIGTAVIHEALDAVDEAQRDSEPPVWNEEEAVEEEPEAEPERAPFHLPKRYVQEISNDRGWMTVHHNLGFIPKGPECVYLIREGDDIREQVEFVTLDNCTIAVEIPEDTEADHLAIEVNP